ncbi:hypothetical protein [Streptomyces sp. NPDC002491]
MSTCQVDAALDTFLNLVTLPPESLSVYVSALRVKVRFSAPVSGVQPPEELRVNPVWPPPASMTATEVDVNVRAKLEPLRGKLVRPVDRGWLRKRPDDRCTIRL